MKQVTLLLFALLPILVFGQTDLRITNGSQWVTSGSVSLVLNNSQLINEGTFEAGQGTVSVTGNAPTNQTLIGGPNYTEFFNLQMNKSASGAALNGNVEIANEVIMTSGLLDLNGHSLVLEGSISDEHNNSRITGLSGGEVIKMVDLGVPSNSNPGNIGVGITSEQDLGQSIVIRGHLIHQVDGQPSIARYIEIIPANNFGLDATLRFHYFQGELSILQQEDLLQQFHGSFNNWSPVTTAQSDLAANWIETNQIDAFEFITLAEGNNPSLPIELLDFQARVNDRNQVALTWTTANEINNDYFTVERSKDGQEFESVLTVDASGTTTENMTYAAIDKAPFSGKSYYRLRQTDFDGTFTFSEIRAVEIQITQEMDVFPNPFTDYIDISGPLSTKEPVCLELINASGITLYSQKINTNGAVLQHQLNNLSALAAGNYVLKMNIGQETQVYKLVKVGL